MKGLIRLTGLLILCMLIPIHGVKNTIKTKHIKNVLPKAPISNSIPKHIHTHSKKYSLPQNFQRFMSSKKASDLGIGIKNKGHVVDDVPKDYERSFGLQYLKNVKNENRNEENIPHNESTPWYKRWWKEIVGAAAVAGLLETAYQNENNTRKGSYQFSFSYLMQSKTKDGKSINLKEVFEKLLSDSSSNRIETFFDDTKENDIKGHFIIEKKTIEIPGYFSNTKKDFIEITSNIKTKGFITDKVNTDVDYIEPLMDKINATCRSGIPDDEKGFEGKCNCTFQFLTDNITEVINYIKNVSSI